MKKKYFRYLQLQLDEGSWRDEDAAASVYFGVIIQLPSVRDVNLEVFLA